MAKLEQSKFKHVQYAKIKYWNSPYPEGTVDHLKYIYKNIEYEYNEKKYCTSASLE